MPKQSTASDLVIESAVPADAEDLRTIQTKTWYDTYPNQERGITREGLVRRQEGEHGERNANRIAFWRKQIETAGTTHAIFMARLVGRSVGYVTVHSMEGQWRIGALYVLPGTQSAGVGSKLLQTALNWYGPDRGIFLHVAEYNQRAIKFYMRHGFMLTGRRFEDDGPAESNIPELEMLRKPVDDQVGG